MSLRYLSLCSGIEAASVAWQPLGWKPVAFSEIEPFPCAVLAHHYPDVPNLGDITQINGNKYRGAVDLIVGGTPCQGFSVAGKRGGMADPRSGLAGCYANLVGDVQPRWIVWENVPGVLSSGKGRDFGAFIRQLAEFGYGVSWRVLDAQYFGVPQRRRRVFVVGYLGDWRPAVSVLFEPGCLLRNTPSRKEKRPHTAQPSAGSPEGCCQGRRIIEQAMSCKWAKGTSGPAGDEHHNLVGCMAFAQNSRNEVRLQGGDGQISGALAADEGTKQRTYVAIPWNSGDAFSTSGNGGRTHSRQILTPQLQVRRLTPRECERLQGFPDDYTLIPYRGKPAADCPDGPRYKALGNSMAVNVMCWIGERIAQSMTAHEQNAENGRNHA